MVVKRTKKTIGGLLTVREGRETVDKAIKKRVCPERGKFITLGRKRGVRAAGKDKVLT